MLRDMFLGLKPFERVSWKRFGFAIAVTGFVIVAGWQLYPSFIMPRPWETVLRGMALLQRGLLGDIGVSLWTILCAGGISFVLGSLISYCIFMADLKPSVMLISILRFLPMSAPIVLLLMLHFNGDQLKLLTMTFIITVYFVASNVQGNFGINPQMVYHGFTLGMSRWQILWHRVVRGAMYHNIGMFLPNFGMGFSMLSLVEGMSRSSGGIGDVMLQQEKIYSFSGMAALCIITAMLGFVLWLIITKLNAGMHPYADQQNQTQGT